MPAQVEKRLGWLLKDGVLKVMDFLAREGKVEVPDFRAGVTQYGDLLLPLDSGITAQIRLEINELTELPYVTRLPWLGRQL